MHHSGAMRFFERVGNLDRNLEQFRLGQRTALQPIRQRLAFEVFHHQEFGCAVAAYVVQNADVRMLQLRDDSSFAFKASAQLGIRYQLRVQNFDRDSSVQPRIPCPVHFPHSTRP